MLTKKRMPGSLLGVMDGGSGNSLERRVLRLLDRRLPWTRQWRVMSACACLIVLSAASLGAGMLGVRASSAQEMARLDVPKVEVISVKPSGENVQGSSLGLRSDEVFASNTTLVQMLEEAYPDMLVN